MADQQTFDEKYQVQNVRVINQLTFLQTVLAVALGIVAGGVLVLMIGLVYA